jgi:hypothetical protein
VTGGATGGALTARRGLRTLPGMAVPRKRAWALALGVGLLVVPARPSAQEIYQAVILDLTDLAVHVTVARARGDEQLRLLLRDTGGRIRQASATSVSAGLASGGTTILTIPLPLLDARETEFAVALVRADTELHRTEWRPIFRPK